MSSAEEEALIPFATREEVIARDEHVCRVCGTWAEVPHVHHIKLRSQGGKDYLDNLISLDWKCHLYVVHRNTRLWSPLLAQAAITPGVNARQLLRWYRASQKGMP